ncbi:MAG: hypothetical protein ACRC0L_03560 [Angustibacter sp.]
MAVLSSIAAHVLPPSVRLPDSTETDALADPLAKELAKVRP